MAQLKKNNEYIENTLWFLSKRRRKHSVIIDKTIRNCLSLPSSALMLEVVRDCLGNTLTLALAISKMSNRRSLVGVFT